jgi:hypothetical protein
MISNYRSVVEAVRRWTGASPELLHIHAGLLIWVLAALILRRPLRSPVPLAVVVAAELVNEIMDRLFWGEWRPDTAADILATCGWPALLTGTLMIEERLRR